MYQLHKINRIYLKAILVLYINQNDIVQPTGIKHRHSQTGGRDDQMAGKIARLSELLVAAPGIDTAQDSTLNYLDSFTHKQLYSPIL